uniref:Late endosomal/lysosomal adaptor and MAPK and MTOR activator 1 n=1 Tax=Steinernema glaseri TaxID=37863 RepID=A0A1I8AD18_9BILA
MDIAMDLVRKFCCCTGGNDSEDSDQRQLIDEQNDFNVITARNPTNNTYGSNGLNGPTSENGIVPFTAFPTISTTEQEVSTGEGNDTAMFNEILQDTLDVSNRPEYFESEVSSLTEDDIKRIFNVNEYNEEIKTKMLLKQVVDDVKEGIIDVSAGPNNSGINNAEQAQRARFYDEQLRKHDQAVAARAGTTPGQETSDSVGVLKNVGNHVMDMLTRPAPSSSVIKAVEDLANQVTNAVNEGIKVQNKESLVVYMD